MHLHISYTKDMLEGHLNHEIFNAGLSNFNHEFFNHWVEKFMVEKSGVEMSFNRSEGLAITYIYYNTLGNVH